MACRICPRTGQKFCDEEEFEIMCSICGQCEKEEDQYENHR
jgi:hypothetical protein